ncbi:hypothetical protein FQA39_LY16241 [Lamprigera yunnana]|nr:hypothetical protein FQA39_LY16241 [Lamprigera yunnana]
MNTGGKQILQLALEQNQYSDEHDDLSNEPHSVHLDEDPGYVPPNSLNSVFYWLENYEHKEVLQSQNENLQNGDDGIDGRQDEWMEREDCSLGSS